MHGTIYGCCFLMSAIEQLMFTITIKLLSLSPPRIALILLKLLFWTGLQKVLKLYMKELPAMNYAANTGKESLFLERCVSSG